MLLNPCSDNPENTTQHKQVATRALATMVAAFNHKRRETCPFFITHQSMDQINLSKKAILNHNQINLKSLFVNRP